MFIPPLGKVCLGSRRVIFSAILLLPLLQVNALGQLSATMISPAPGSKLSGTTATFTWSAGTGVEAYELWLGSADGKSDLYFGESATQLARTTINLPNNGGAIYARLYSKIDGVWQFTPYRYIAAGTAAPAQMISPAPGSKLSGTTATFTWSAGTGVEAYELWLGSADGKSDLYFGESATQLAMTAGKLPNNGGAIYARLYSKIDGVWQYDSYSFTSAGPPALALMISPVPGSMLSGTTATFTWSPGTEVEAYELWLGTANGKHDLYYEESSTALSANVTNLLNDGSTIYVRLYSKIAGAWQCKTYTYLAVGPQPAEIISPVPDSQLPSVPVKFTWSPGYGATSYGFCLGTASGQCDLYQSTGTALSATVPILPTTGATVYATLSSQLASGWRYLHYQYLAPGHVATSARAIPDHGTGVARRFRFVYDWKSGSPPFRFVEIQFGSSPDDSAGCSVIYDTSTNTVRFSTDNSSIAVGSTNTLSNPYCTLSAVSSIATQSPTQLLLTLDLQFLSSGSMYDVFTRAWLGDDSEVITPPGGITWNQVGTWTVRDESWPLIDTSRYSVATAIARQSYLNYGYDYRFWMAKYDPLGTHFNSENEFAWYVDYPSDAQGLPTWDGTNYNMVTLAQFALCRWGRYIKDIEPPAYFLEVADKLLALMQPDGSLLYQFPAVGQKPPWTSGMAQGLVLSVFARAFSLTQNPKYLDAGRLVLNYMVAFKTSPGDRSDLGDIARSLDGYEIIEETPASPWATHILNGFEFGILGVNDWAAITGDLEAKAYFDSSMETLEKALPYWDLGAWTSYDLNYLIQGNSYLDPAASEYQALHIALQDTLGQITGDPRFYAYRDRWINQITTPQVNVTLPTPVSVSPDSGAGSGGIFQFLFRSPNGISQMGQVIGILNTSPTFTGGCGVSYDVSTTKVVLQGTGSSVSGYAGAIGTLSVPECTMDLQNTSVTITDTDLLLTVPLSFTTSLVGQKYYFLQALSAAKNPSSSYNYAKFGSWNVCISTCPAENLQVSKHSLLMGTVGVGSSASYSLTVTNPASTVATLGTISITGTEFAETNTCGVFLSPGQKCTIMVIFSPTKEGPVSASLDIVHSLNAGSLIIPLTGTGTSSVLAASPTALNFGYSVVDQSIVQSFIVSNYTTSNVTISSVELLGTGFSEVDSCSGKSLSPGATCSVTITCIPSRAGQLTGEVAITTSDSGTLTVPLQVIGVQP